MTESTANLIPTSVTQTAATAAAAPREGLSYKFQRLRERLRQAIVSGELSGKLPGERELAKRFKANPKTLSKALTDLAGEGLLDRSIGRGTYVRGSAPAHDFTGRWLIIAGDDAASRAVVGQLKQTQPEAEVVTEVTSARPSFISQFDTVIDLSPATADGFHRDLLVRGITSVLINREPGGGTKHHAVLLDRAHAAHALARDLFLAGHRRIVVIEQEGCEASTVARTAAARYCPHGTVISVRPDDVPGITDRANTALLCDGAELARHVMEIAATHAILARASIVALGVSDAADFPCTGIFATPSEIASAAVALLRGRQQQHRPAVVWLTGTYAERGTLRAIPEHRFEIVDGLPPTALSA